MPIRLTLPALAALLTLVAAAPQTASAKYKECEFTAKKAKRKHAPRCAKELGKSRWIVVSGEWRQVLTVDAQLDDATFHGTGQADFRAGGLSGASAFPNRRNPTVSMTSTWPGGVDFSASSQGGWTAHGEFYDCGWTAPEGSAPDGFGGIFSRAGKNVRVQWLLGGVGFGCGNAPYDTPRPEFRDTVAKYPLASFKGRRIVELPIAFDQRDNSGDLDARMTYDGVARLRRYR